MPDGLLRTKTTGVTGGLLNTTINACQNNPSYPNFFGTSAAAPQAVPVAAAAAAASGHSGGGGLDMLGLFGLAGMGLARFFRLRPRVLI